MFLANCNRHYLIEKKQMCKGKNTCSELGTDPNFWDKQTPLRTPKFAANAINIFEEAVELFILGKRNECLAKLDEINSAEITEWYVEHGQMSGRHRKLILKVQFPTSISEDKRDPVRSPAKIQNEVFKRDGYKCRYCGNKLISQDFLRLFIKKLNSSTFQRGHTNLTTHGIIHIAWPVADHVIPWNLGGRTSLSNLVTSCATCNYGKDGFTIEQLGIENPFLRAEVKDSWVGLTNKLDLLKKINNN